MNFVKNCLTKQWAGRGVLALLGGYMLWSMQLEMLDKIEPEMNEHILMLLSWTVFMYVTFWIADLLVQLVFYWRFRDRNTYVEFIAKMLLFFFITLVVCPFLFVKLLNGWYYHWDGPAYGKENIQRMVYQLQVWVLAYSAFRVFYRAHKKHFRTEKMMSKVYQQKSVLKKDLFLLRYSEDLEHTFMLIRKGDGGYRLKKNGMFVKDKRRLSAVKEVLEEGYIETFKGININKKSIERIDIEEQRVYLVKEAMEALKLMLEKFEELKAIEEGIKSENGLLNLSPVMEARLREEGKLNDWLNKED